MDSKSKRGIFLNKIINENPVFVLTLGMCPTLAVTTSLQSGIVMGLSLLTVLLFSNVCISLIRKIVPNEIRIPVYIVIIATFVTIVEMLLKAQLPGLYEKLGVFVSLIVVNCIVFGRAESFASKNKVILSFIDALGVGLGFLFALVLVSSIREILGTGVLTIWSDVKIDFMPFFDFLKIKPTSFFVGNPGAFIILALLIGTIQTIVNYRKRIKQKSKETKEMKKERKGA
jgi:electron transport complex protein RnfE